MKILYLDESGDHDLVNIDTNYPVFVLSGCILDSGYHDNALKPSLDRFKQDTLGRADVILHYADYTRDGAGFEIMSDIAKREDFYKRLNKLIDSTDFTLLACIIDKTKHLRHYKYPINPYILSLEIIIEKFVMFLNKEKDQGMIIAESRNNQLDNELNLAFLDIKISGTRFLNPSEIVDRIDNNFYIKRKGEDISGLQLADSIITPIGRKYLGLKNRYLDYNIIKDKFHKHACGRYRGYGLVILPKG
jgi:hypothetical protein